jgi:outer membrane protein assembly factor BamA
MEVFLRNFAFDQIEITGNKIYSDLQVRGVLDIEPAEELDKYMLRDQIELLYGKAWVDKVKYRIVPGNDSPTLVVECIEKPRDISVSGINFESKLQESGQLV